MKDKDKSMEVVKVKACLICGGDMCMEKYYAGYEPPTLQCNNCDATDKLFRSTLGQENREISVEQDGKVYTVNLDNIYIKKGVADDLLPQTTIRLSKSITKA